MGSSAKPLTKISEALPGPFVEELFVLCLLLEDSLESRKGFLDTFLFGVGNGFGASVARGEGELARLRKGLLEGRLKDRPGEGWRSTVARRGAFG